MMKKIILMCQLAPVFTGLMSQLNAQSIAPQVIATAGGYQSTSVGSISFTIGETNTKTLSSANNMLTQGFQQPFELNLINVKAFLQGYYISSNQMQDVLYNQGEYTNPSLITDTITVELHHATTPFALAFQTKSALKQNGNINITGLGVVGQSYYIVLKHRNTVETWSANPVLLSSNISYDFSIAANKAFGDNQVSMGNGQWSVYSGDINQDQVIDAFDYILLDPDIINGASGYLTTDLTGDGVVDAFDYILLDANLINGVGAITP
jgi:hypothetical protein